MEDKFFEPKITNNLPFRLYLCLSPLGGMQNRTCRVLANFVSLHICSRQLYCLKTLRTIYRVSCAQFLRVSAAKFLIEPSSTESVGVGEMAS